MHFDWHHRVTWLGDGAVPACSGMATFGFRELGNG